MRFQVQPFRIVLFALACAVLGVAMTACGSSDSSSSSAGESSTGSTETGSAGDESAIVREAEEKVAEAKQPLTEFPGPTEPAGKPPADKEIATVKVLPAPYPNHMQEGVESAAQVVGWEVRDFTADGTPQGYETALSSAIASKPDALFLLAMPAAFLQRQLSEAEKLGIPVIALVPGLPHENGKTLEEWHLLNVMVEDSALAGETLAAWVVAHAPEGAKTLALDSPEFVDMQDASKGFRKVVESAGPSFTNEAVIKSPVSDVSGGQTGVNRLASPMKKYSDADFFFINSENWVPTFLQAAQAAGRSGEVTALGLSGDVSIPLAQEGQPIVMMGTATKTIGWMAVDSIIRYWNDKPQPEYKVPLTLVDSENADTYDTENIEPKYDVAAGWEGLWK